MIPALPKNIRADNNTRKSGVISKLPSWFRQEIPEEVALSRMRLLSQFNVNTVCSEAKCPNQSLCFKNSRLAFLILGNRCTRNCRFCAVNKAESRSLALDWEEPYRIAEIVKELGLNYVVITSVTRDDLEDGGAGIFAKTVELIHEINPVRDIGNSNNESIVSNGIKIEVLIPDFGGNITSLQAVINSAPSVIAHNIETVRRLYEELRPHSNYELCLEVLRKIKQINPFLITKSSLMLGLGETETEVVNTMDDLRFLGCDILTLGQYLAPSVGHYPVKEFIDAERFQKYGQLGRALGFKAVLSGPLVRSSYQAEEVFREVAYV